MKAGHRVFWHGISPDPKKIGTVKRTGTIHHEVQWDGSPDTSLENVNFLMSVAKFGRCCTYCRSLRESLTPKKKKADTTYVIKVDGEEMDHADTRAEAKRHRDTLIYGEIGTAANTTIEPKRRPSPS